MNLLDQLMQAGLIQFGLFDGAPIRLNLQLLPSYPDILSQAVDEMALLLDEEHYDRLVCTSDSMPVGMALSLKTRIPLVYSQGSDLPPVYDLVGAYDVGHPAVLIVNTWQADGVTYKLIENARRVGLDISTVYALFDLTHHAVGSQLPVRALMQLSAVIKTLVETEQLPTGQADAVQQWIVSS